MTRLAMLMSSLSMMLSCDSHMSGPDADSGPEAGGDTTSIETTDLDVLFVVENAEAAFSSTLAQVFAPRIATWSSSEGSIHIAAVSSYLGVRDGLHEACTERGDDGVFASTENIRGAGCVEDVRHWSVRATPEPESGQRFTCAVTGLSGEMTCSIDHMLDASLKALATGADGVRFFGEVGHGAGANAGFRRRDVPLLLVFASLQDDCSTHDPRFFTDDYAVRGRAQCIVYPEALHPLERYDIWSDLAPAGVHVVVLGGIPEDLAAGTPSDALADPRMTPTLSADGEDIVHTCPEPEVGGRSRPPFRILSAAQRFGASVTMGSTCSLAALQAGADRVDAKVAELTSFSRGG